MARRADAVVGAKCQRDAFEADRHRQLRRLRHKRRRRQKDRGADGAIIVIVARMLRRRFLRCLRDIPGGSDVGGMRCATEKQIAQMHFAKEVHIGDVHVADVNMPERQHKLQHQRRKPRPRTVSPMVPHPPHGRHANVTMLHLARGNPNPAHSNTFRMSRRASAAPQAARSDAKRSPSRRSDRRRQAAERRNCTSGTSCLS